MAPFKILSILALILVISSVSDASKRILMADENPNSEKGLPAPTPILPQNNKEKPQNLQPGKKGDEGKKESGGNVKSGESGKKGDEPLNSEHNGKKSDEQKGSSENSEKSNDPSKNVKGDGNEGSNDPTKNVKGDGQNGTSDASKNEESGKKGDGKKGSDDPTKKENDKTGDGQNGNNDPTKKEESGGKKGDGKKESGPAAKKEESGKKKEGNDPSKNGENGNKGYDPLKDEEGGEKGDGKKRGNDPSNSREKSEKGDVHKGKEEPRKEEVIPQSCDVKCHDQDLVACLQHTEIGSQEFVLHVQNRGGKSLTVNITVPTSVKVDDKTLNIPETRHPKVEATKSLKVALDSEKGHCQLLIAVNQSVGVGPSINGWNPFHQLSSTQLMPIYGGFLLFIIAIVGACGVSVNSEEEEERVLESHTQQLEMGSQVPSSTAIESSLADGWDQSWDDDWDDEGGNQGIQFKA